MDLWSEGLLGLRSGVLESKYCSSLLSHYILDMVNYGCSWYWNKRLKQNQKKKEELRNFLICHLIWNCWFHHLIKFIYSRNVTVFYMYTFKVNKFCYMLKELFIIRLDTSIFHSFVYPPYFYVFGTISVDLICVALHTSLFLFFLQVPHDTSTIFFLGLV